MSNEVIRRFGPFRRDENHHREMVEGEETSSFERSPKGRIRENAFKEISSGEVVTDPITIFRTPFS